MEIAFPLIVFGGIWVGEDRPVVFFDPTQIGIIARCLINAMSETASAIVIVVLSITGPATHRRRGLVARTSIEGTGWG